MEIIYYWYHQGLAWAQEDTKYYNDYKQINSCLHSRNYEVFLKMKETYNDCLPDKACVYENGELVEYIDITIPANFKQITCVECECG